MSLMTRVDWYYHYTDADNTDGSDCMTCYDCNSYTDGACRQKNVLYLHKQNFTKQCCGAMKGCRFTLQVGELIPILCPYYVYISGNVIVYIVHLAW